MLSPHERGVLARRRTMTVSGWFTPMADVGASPGSGRAEFEPLCTRSFALSSAQVRRPGVPPSGGPDEVRRGNRVNAELRTPVRPRVCGPRTRFAFGNIGFRG